MAAIKILSFILIFCPILSFGQKSMYPKDTIYVKYQEIKDTEWNAKFERRYNQKLGVYFNIETRKGNMTLFYPYTEKADTLCIKDLKDYHFSDLEEINEKRRRWIFDNKRPPATRNGVFQTYVIEVISDKKFVKYPVTWRNERI